MWNLLYRLVINIRINSERNIVHQFKMPRMMTVNNVYGYIRQASSSENRYVLKYTTDTTNSKPR